MSSPDSTLVRTDERFRETAEITTVQVNETER
jgi:hypothetical protein